MKLLSIRRIGWRGATLPVVVVLVIAVPVIGLAPVVSVPLAIMTVLHFLPANLPGLCPLVGYKVSTAVVVTLPVLNTGISLAALIVRAGRECESSEGINGQKEKAVDEGVAHKVLN